MCGLVAVINKRRNGFSHEQREIFTTLLYVDTLRGEDSTGMFVVDKYGNVKLAKDTSIGPIFVKTDEYKKLAQEAFQNGWAMVGHNRKATRGTITDKNAHPFVVDDKIVLVHNGSFFGDHKHLAETDVDSEAIAHVLSKTDNPEEAFKKINAAYACIWYNVDNKQLNLIRNDQRPLFWMETADTYVIASEAAFLSLVAIRHNLKIDGTLHAFKEHELMTFSLEKDHGTSVETKDLDCDYKFVGKASNQNFPVAVPTNQENGGNATPTETRRTPGPLRVINQGEIQAFNQTLVVQFLKEQLTSSEFMTYGEYFEAREHFYRGQKLRVIIYDIIEADDDPRTNNYVLLGSYLGDKKINVAIPITESDFNAASAKANHNIFEVSYRTMTWSNIETDSSKQFTDKYGVAIMLVHNPVPVDVETIEVLH